MSGLKNSTNKDTAAKILRIITAPPFMIAILLAAFDIVHTDLLLNTADRLFAWIGLVFLPILAYLIHRVVPALRKTGRDGQRKIAFICSLIGYTICFIYSFFTDSADLRFIFHIYFFTAVFLAVINRFLHIRASAHAASSSGPCVFSGIYTGIWFTILFVLLFLFSIWSSLYLKRHKVTDILTGIATFILAFFLACLINKV